MHCSSREKPFAPGAQTTCKTETHTGTRSRLEEEKHPTQLGQDKQRLLRPRAKQTYLYKTRSRLQEKKE